MMKIALIVPDFYPSQTGYANAFRGLCNSLLIREDVEKIHIYDLKHNKQDVKSFDKRVSVISLKFLGINMIFNHTHKLIAWAYIKIFNFKKLNSLLSDLKTNEIDLILVETAELSWMSYYLSKKTKIPIVTRLHGAFPEAATLFSKEVTYGKTFLNYLLRTENIAVTTYHYINFLKKYETNHINLRNKNFFILPNTLHQKNKNLIIDDSKEQLNVIQLGRMDKRGYYYKGFADSINAFLYLEDTLSDTQLKRLTYTVIGDGDNASDFQRLLNKITKIKINYSKKLPHEEVMSLVGKSSIVLMPSRNEGMSMFALEAVSMGKPIIFTKDNGLTDLIIDDFNGIEIRSINYIDISKAIIKYIDSPELIKRHSLNSFNHYEKYFNNNSFLKYFNVIEKNLL